MKKTLLLLSNFIFSFCCFMLYYFLFLMIIFDIFLLTNVVECFILLYIVWCLCLMVLNMDLKFIILYSIFILGCVVWVVITASAVNYRFILLYIVWCLCLMVLNMNLKFIILYSIFILGCVVLIVLIMVLGENYSLIYFSDFKDLSEVGKKDTKGLDNGGLIWLGSKDKYFYLHGYLFSFLMGSSFINDNMIFCNFIFMLSDSHMFLNNGLFYKSFGEVVLVLILGVLFMHCRFGFQKIVCFYSLLVSELFYFYGSFYEVNTYSTMDVELIFKSKGFYFPSKYSFRKSDYFISFFVGDCCRSFDEFSQVVFKLSSEFEVFYIGLSDNFSKYNSSVFDNIFLPFFNYSNCLCYGNFFMVLSGFSSYNFGGSTSSKVSCGLFLNLFFLKGGLNLDAMSKIFYFFFYLHSIFNESSQVSLFNAKEFSTGFYVMDEMVFTSNLCMFKNCASSSSYFNSFPNYLCEVYFSGGVSDEMICIQGLVSISNKDILMNEVEKYNSGSVDWFLVHTIYLDTEVIKMSCRDDWCYNDLFMFFDPSLSFSSTVLFSTFCGTYYFCSKDMVVRFCHVDPRKSEFVCMYDGCDLFLFLDMFQGVFKEHSQNQNCKMFSGSFYNKSTRFHSEDLNNFIGSQYVVSDESGVDNVYTINSQMNMFVYELEGMDTCSVLSVYNDKEGDKYVGGTQWKTLMKKGDEGVFSTMDFSYSLEWEVRNTTTRRGGGLVPHKLSSTTLGKKGKVMAINMSVEKFHKLEEVYNSFRPRSDMEGGESVCSEVFTGSEEYDLESDEDEVDWEDYLGNYYGSELDKGKGASGNAKKIIGMYNEHKKSKLGTKPENEGQLLDFVDEDVFGEMCKMASVKAGETQFYGNWVISTSYNSLEKIFYRCLFSHLICFYSDCICNKKYMQCTLLDGIKFLENPVYLHFLMLGSGELPSTFCLYESGSNSSMLESNSLSGMCSEDFLLYYYLICSLYIYIAMKFYMFPSKYEYGLDVNLSYTCMTSDRMRQYGMSMGEYWYSTREMNFLMKFMDNSKLHLAAFSFMDRMSLAGTVLDFELVLNDLLFFFYFKYNMDKNSYKFYLDMNESHFMKCVSDSLPSLSEAMGEKAYLKYIGGKNKFMPWYASTDMEPIYSKNLKGSKKVSFLTQDIDLKSYSNKIMGFKDKSSGAGLIPKVSTESIWVGDNNKFESKFKGGGNKYHVKKSKKKTGKK